MKITKPAQKAPLAKTGVGLPGLAAIGVGFVGLGVVMVGSSRRETARCSARPAVRRRARRFGSGLRRIGFAPGDWRSALESLSPRGAWVLGRAPLVVLSSGGCRPAFAGAGRLAPGPPWSGAL